MKSHISAVAVGFLFALGLGISGMTNPQKVFGFLDLFGAWDPSLMFVMVGAIAVHALSYQWIRKLKTPFFEKEWHVPNKKDITPRLIIGAFIFGVGWGLAGYCPGPAITSLPSLQVAPLLFVFGMVLGMIFYKITQKFLGTSK